MRPEKIGTGSALFSCQRAATFPPHKREEGKVHDGLRFYLKTTATQAAHSIRETKRYVKLIPATVAPFLLSPVE
jgi:hypothetical protein